MTVPWFLVLCAPFMLCGCMPGNSRRPDEDPLTARVEEGVRLRLAPDELVKYVGEDAVVDTRRKSGDVAWWFAKRTLDIDQAREKQMEGTFLEEVLRLQPSDFAQGTVIMYWVRPLKTENPWIVGVAWVMGRPPCVFYAVMYPP